nr:MAG TPA: hypothetical protein [Caudoviricetes sp.]
MRLPLITDKAHSNRSVSNHAHFSVQLTVRSLPMDIIGQISSL